MHRKKILILTISLLTGFYSLAQDVNLDSLLDAEMDKKKKSETQYTEGTFNTSLLINGQTVETTQAGVLNIQISHRFGTLNEGFYNLYGLDNAYVRLGAEYGLTKRLTIGGGRSAFEKQYDGFLKYRLLWQSTGKHNMPISLTLVGSAMLKTLKDPLDTIKRNASDRYYFAYQALIARKFSSRFSLQLMPTVVHYNLVPTSDIPNDLFSIGAGARIKISNHSNLIAEYYYQLPGYKLPGSYNTFSVGYEIETGGHVFQFHLSNSTGMADRPFITETSGKWSNGDIHLGFNISRVFTIRRPKDVTQFLNSTPPEMMDTAKNEIPKNPTGFVQKTFTTTRLMNGHTVETTQAGVLDLKVSHRFGTLNEGFYNLYGLDEASMRIGLDYGITDRLTIGGGRSTFEKQYDWFLKYRLLWQSTGEHTMPLSVTLLTSAMLKTMKNAVDTVKTNGSDNWYYAGEMLIARKFNDVFSFQLMPTIVHYNLVDAGLPNNLYSIGAGARIKLSKRTAINLEYYYQLPGHKLPGTYNSFAIGYEIETAGHVFQLQFTNSTGMTERTFITGTTGQWQNGDIHFGFNISRVFALKKPKKID